MAQKLYDASRQGHMAELERLLDSKALIDGQDQYGMTALHTACKHGKTDIVKLLVERKANLNITNKIGDTPLIRAARWDQIGIVQVLVKAGADTTIRGYFTATAAERAKYMHHHTIADYLNFAVRFQSSARDESGQLHRAQGRSLRAIDRDLEENDTFDDHMLHRLKQFCL